ncbi:tyrosine-type recombinase/integrase [Curtobacterium sp. S6]|uniref:tyrosine-type recombinase/integrase n=1 Tax=Curtobacterium sp. S6 TaxID=1479623 RepID=UPI000689623E
MGRPRSGFGWGGVFCVVGHDQLRRREIAALHTDRRDGDWLTITGNGGATRLVPVHPILVPYLDLKVTGWYLPGRLERHRSADFVGKRISLRLGPDDAGHQLRLRYVTATYAATRDLRAVQELLGHADVSTTQTYVGVDED